LIKNQSRSLEARVHQHYALELPMQPPRLQFSSGYDLSQMHTSAHNINTIGYTQQWHICLEFVNL
jgi:hypothetical protein